MSGNSAPWPWHVLGLEAPEANKKTIRRAYAKRLKAIDPAKDPAGFQALREAYEVALREAHYIELEDANPDPEPFAPPVAEADTAPETDEAIRPVEVPKTEPEPEIREIIRRVEVPHHAPEPTPEPEPPNEDIAALNALTEEVNALLDLHNFDNTRWAAVVRDPLLDVFAYASEIEHRIFGGLYTRIKTDENGEQRLPPFATPRWIELIDQRFGWTADLPLFKRKFGWQGGQILPLLSERLYYGKPNLPETYQTKMQTRRPWLQRAVMLCAGYFVLRLAILAVLP